MTNRCFHCDLEIPKGQEFHLWLINQQRAFCCAGCLAVAETIRENKLEEFYRFRTEHNKKIIEVLPQELIDLQSLDNQAVLASISTESNNIKTIELGIEGITCAACGWLIKKQITKREDVLDIQINITTRRAVLKFKHDALLSPILKQIRNLGYRAFPFSENNLEKSIQVEDKAFIKQLIIAGIAMMQVMMYATGLYIGEFQDMSAEHALFLHWVSGIVATPVVFYSALPFFSSAWRSLKFFHFGMNLPVSIAILAGYFASIYSLLSSANVYYFDSVVMFTFFLLIGRFLEHRMRFKAILKQQNFNQLLPLSVTRKNSDGTMSIILVNEIKLNDELIVNSGSVVATDGLLLSDQAELNEAILTGEFFPVSKIKGDNIVSGSTNNSAGFVMRVTSRVQDSRLQQLIKLQNNTDILSETKLSLADRIASGYVIGLLILSCFTGFIWWQIDPQQIFPVILSLLVVSCPCALSLATPTAMAAAISQLTDKGLMVKHQDTLLKLSKVDTVIFDKTGTLTLANMSLIKTLTHSSINENQCLQIASSLETISNHPVAHVFKKLQLKGLNNINNQEVIAGGVSGKINGDNYYLGNRNFISANVGEINLTQENKQQNQIAIYLTKNKQHIATFLLQDQLNPTSIEAVTNIQKFGFETIMLSGDSTESCQAMAEMLNINSVIANATPESKLEIVNQQKKDSKNILMVGDGINDIGALANANVSITMGTASDLSQFASSAVLVSQDLNTIYQSLILAKKLDKIIKQNLTWAVIYNVLAIPFAMAGLIPAWAAAIGMTSSSLIVVLNALRLKN